MPLCTTLHPNTVVPLNDGKALLVPHPSEWRPFWKRDLRESKEMRHGTPCPTPGGRFDAFVSVQRVRPEDNLELQVYARRCQIAHRKPQRRVIEKDAYYAQKHILSLYNLQSRFEDLSTLLDGAGTVGVFELIFLATNWRYSAECEMRASAKRACKLHTIACTFTT